MQLQITGSNKGKPTIEIITKVVNDESYRDEFFIIIKDDESFLQATGPNSGLHVEYKDAATNQIFFCSSGITCDELIALCMNYISEDNDWRKPHQWLPIEELNRGNSQATWSITGL